MFKTIGGILLVCVCGLTAIQAQTTKKSNSFADSSACSSFLDTLTNRTVFTAASRNATVDGGEQKLLEELRKLKYPPLDLTTVSIQTKIIVAFVVDTTGQIIGKRIIKNIEGTDLAQQVLTLVDNLKWIHATCNDRAIPMFYQLPVQIELK